MSHVAPSSRVEKTHQRARRIVSERSAARRAWLLDGLTDPPVVAETIETLAARARTVARAFDPRNDWQDWLTSHIATIMIRLDRCERIERRLRDYASYRAIDFWEEDQALAAATVAARLHLDPGRVVARLRQSPAGCDWLLQRWWTLSRLEPSAWTGEHRLLAARLLGGDDEIDPTTPGLIAEEVAELAAQQERVEAADAILRGLVEADLSDEGVAGLGKLRRYARSLHRQMKWYVDQFHVEHSDRWDDPMRQPGTISHDLLRQQQSRKINWSFTEPPRPTPEPAATQPVAATQPFAETKPLASESDETKPPVQVELIAHRADAMPELVGESPVTSPSSVDQAATHRETRVSPAGQAVRRDKARRRQAALAGV